MNPSVVAFLNSENISNKEIMTQILCNEKSSAVNSFNNLQKTAVIFK